jgi:phosphoribosyl 1,2-cyclic phosphate phosphodiesterase
VAQLSLFGCRLDSELFKPIPFALKITFLGTGTSYGVPMIACDCQVCSSTDPLNKRLRSSIFVESSPVRLIVDTTPDFRAQCLREKIDNLDAIVYTHEHSDHLLGLDEVRRFCALHDKRLPIYGSARVLEYIGRMFPYALQNPIPFRGLPAVDLHEIVGKFKLNHLQLTPFSMPHGNTQTLGFRFDDDRGPRFAYLTDCKEVSPEIRREIKNIPLLILDALRHTPHPTHLSISEALEVLEEVQPQRTLFTHICHDLDHHQTNANLPKGVSLAYDGQTIEI